MTRKALEVYKETTKDSLINHYNQLISEIIERAQELNSEQRCLPDENQRNMQIRKEKNFIVEQILRVQNSNLNDINEFFDNLNPNENDIIKSLTKENDYYCSYYDTEDIKKKALKSYLIHVDEVYLFSK